MDVAITVPLWVLLLIGALACLSFLHHFLLPSVRWVFRRRANQVIEDVNQRLALRIPSFKLTKREVLIDRLTYHPQVMAEVESVAKKEHLPRDAVIHIANGYAREIVPAFNAFLYFKCGYWFARKLVHMLYRVRLGFADDASLGQLDQSSSVVFLMNHRSNMDYILATYLAAERTALSYAVGEWARVWPLQQLIRSMGGYFVRRNSGDPLYRRVLQSYVQMAAEGGVPQAVFPEGGLSKDGHIGEAKLGLLGYITKGFTIDSERDIVFVPVGLNYDRVLEDRTLLRSKNNSKQRMGKFFTLSTSLKFLGKNIMLAVTGRWYRNGYACVNFGTPLSLKEWLREQQNNPAAQTWEDQVSLLAKNLMHQIGEIIPILPVALVASVFQQSDDLQISHLELKTRVFGLIKRLEAEGRHVYIPRSNLDYAVNVGIRMLVMRHILNDDQGLLSVNKNEVELLQYYAASIAHLVAEKPTVAIN